MSAETSTNTLGATNHSNKEREELDFYQTPQYAVDSLIGAFEPFKDKTVGVWEPTAGNGAISSRFEKAGFSVFKSDLVERKIPVFKLDYLHGVHPVLEDRKLAVVMNPPYDLASEFILKTLDDVRPDWLCVFLPVRYLEGQKRFDQIYSRHRPSHVFVYKKRLGCFRESDAEQGKVTDRGVTSAVAYCWICWSKCNPYGKTELEWL